MKNIGEVKNIVEIQNIRGYIDGNGTAHINLEDAARGLGFVQTRWNTHKKKTMTDIRWNRIKQYCLEIGHPLVDDGKKNAFIPENMFYKLCMKANNDVARKFQDLVCDEILPQIRKTGGYIPVDNESSEEDIMAKALVIAQRTIASKKQMISQLESRIKNDAGRVAFAESVEEKADCILVREFAKIVTGAGIDIGEKRLYNWFREKGFILRDGREPSQKSVDKGLFKVYERILQTVKGEIVTQTTKITGKGQIYFLDLLKKEFLK